MAGYSGTPLARKLGIKANDRVALVNAPEDFEKTLRDLPEGATLQTDLRGIAQDVIVLFAASRSELVKWFPRCAARLTPAGGLWVAWAKKASGILTGLWEKVRENPDEFLDLRVVDSEGLDAATRDFIAGMTDRYAVSLYEQLFIPKPWTAD